MGLIIRWDFCGQALINLKRSYLNTFCPSFEAKLIMRSMSFLVKFKLYYLFNNSSSLFDIFPLPSLSTRSNINSKCSLYNITQKNTLVQSGINLFSKSLRFIVEIGPSSANFFLNIIAYFKLGSLSAYSRNAEIFMLLGFLSSLKTWLI